MMVEVVAKSVLVVNPVEDAVVRVVCPETVRLVKNVVREVSTEVKRLVVVALVAVRLVEEASVETRVVVVELVKVVLVAVMEVNVGVADTPIVEVEESTMLDPAMR